MPRRIPLLLCLAALVPGADATPFSAAQTPEAIRAVCTATTAWQLDHLPKRDATEWTNATFYRGLATWGTVGADANAWAVIDRTGRANGWKTREKDDGNLHADNQAIGETWLLAYRRDHLAEQLAPTRSALEQLAGSPVGDLKFGMAACRRDWVWADALFMAPPILAHLGEITGDARWLAHLDARFWATTDYLYDPAEHLFFRDSRYLTKKEANGAKVFWGRGNGWVMAGLVQVLQHLPASHPTRAKYERLFTAMSERLAGLQTADGTWHASLLDPATFDAPESSGTAFYCYALAWGLDQGLLAEERYRSVVDKAWTALIGHVQADGKLGYVQKIGESPTKVGADSTENYGVGGLLFAGSQLYLHAILKDAVRAPIQVRNPTGQVRLDEVASLPWARAQQLVPGLTPANVAVRDLQTGHLSPVQTIDEDGDGTIDDLLFVATVPPQGTRRFEVIRLAGPQPAQLPSRLHARFVPERKDDFAWENDRSAHRTYGPAIASEGTRGGIDVWSKRIRDLVVDRWYKSGKYHEDAGEGCDCYHVGPTLGCGGLGYLDAQGNLTTAPYFATHATQATGPLRLAFTLTYPPVQIGAATITETRRFRMDLGSPVFRSSSTWKVTGDAAGITPVAGVRADAGAVPPPGTTGVGTTWVEAEKGKAKNGSHGELVIVPPGTAIRAVGGHLVGQIAASLTGTATWHAGATWSKGADATTPEAWDAEATAVAERLAHPLLAE